MRSIRSAPRTTTTAEQHHRNKKEIKDNCSTVIIVVHKALCAFTLSLSLNWRPESTLKILASQGGGERVMKRNARAGTWQPESTSLSLSLSLPGCQSSATRISRKVRQTGQ